MAAVSVVVAEYDPAWPERFARYAASLREALGDRASRIDHIGSTAVPGLAAEDVIDIQVSVRGFEPFEPLRAGIEGAGFDWIPDNDDGRKRFFRLVGADDRRLANIHVRNLGEFSEQAALLFRDYPRATPQARHRYEETKRTLATRTCRASTTTQMRRATASGCSSARRTAGRGTLPGSPAPPAPSSR